jgi:glycosyltransferase involved in cell wall biosynthesis
VNLLLIDQFSDLGGAQLCLLDVVPAAQAAGWRVTCAVSGDGKLVDRMRALGVPVHSLHMTPLTSGRKPPLDFVRFGLNAPRLAGEISALAAETQADLLYVNGPRTLPAAAWVARRSGRPLVFHCHNLLSHAAGLKVVGSSLQLARARVIACCRYVARPLWPYVDPGRMHVIYNGIAGMTSTRPGRSGEPRVGVIGRIARENGQMEFVAAARLLSEKRRKGRFVICGAPLFANPEAELYLHRVHLTAAGLPVEFLGWRDDVNSVLGELDLLVVPSASHTATPRVILEAFAARLPVVAFAAGGIPEIVTDQETGFLVEPPEPELLAARIDALIEAPEELRATAGRAYEAWKERYTLERFQREVLAVMGFTQTLSAIGLSI